MAKPNVNTTTRPTTLRKGVSRAEEPFPHRHERDCPLQAEPFHLLGALLVARDDEKRLAPEFLSGVEERPHLPAPRIRIAEVVAALDEARDPPALSDDKIDLIVLLAALPVGQILSRLQRS